MFDELPGLGIAFVLVFSFVGIGGGGAVWVGAVLEGLLMFGFIVEVRRGDESDDLFERVFGVFSDEEVYEGGYGAEETLEVAYDQSRSKFGGRGAVIGFEWYGHLGEIEKHQLGRVVGGVAGDLKERTAFLGYRPELRGFANGGSDTLLVPV